MTPAATQLAALDRHACHWPHGDPKHDGFRFCAAPAVPGWPYCRPHILASRPEPRQAALEGRQAQGSAATISEQPEIIPAL